MRSLPTPLRCHHPLRYCATPTSDPFQPLGAPPPCVAVRLCLHLSLTSPPPFPLCVCCPVLPGICPLLHLFALRLLALLATPSCVPAAYGQPPIDFSAVLSAVLCCAVLCCAVLCCAVLCCAVLCCAVLCCAVLCCAVLCCAVLCCAVLCCAVLCCAVLCCAVLCSPLPLCLRVATSVVTCGEL